MWQGLCCYFRSKFIRRNVRVNLCIKFSKNLLLLPKGKMTTKIFKLFLRNVASVFHIADSTGTAELVSGFPTTSSVYDVSKIAQFFDHDKSSSISQLIRSKLRDLPKLLGY